MTGYEIKKRLCETMSMIASPSYGAVYPTLHRLLDEGAVTVDVVEQEGRPPKKIYAIAEAGQNELETWLREPAMPDRVTREFLLKIFLAHRLTPEHLEAHLGQRRQETENMCQVLEQLDKQPSKQMNGQHGWVIAYAKAMCEAEIGWLNHIEQSLRNGGGQGAD